MPLSKEIISRFHIPTGAKTYVIEINISGKDDDLKQYLMDNIYFEFNERWRLEALPLQEQTSCLTRTLFATCNI